MTLNVRTQLSILIFGFVGVLAFMLLRNPTNSSFRNEQSAVTLAFAKNLENIDSKLLKTAGVNPHPVAKPVAPEAPKRQPASSQEAREMQIIPQVILEDQYEEKQLEAHHQALQRIERDLASPPSEEVDSYAMKVMMKLEEETNKTREQESAAGY